MYTDFGEDAGMMKRIFGLSDMALIHMVNRLFETEYGDGETIWKEWREQIGADVCLCIGGMNRYEFRLRRLEGCIRISAEDRGCAFCDEKLAQSRVVQIREPQILYFGRGRHEEYSTTLEFPGNERVRLPIHMITLEEASVEKLEESGLLPFLPFLFACFASKTCVGDDRQEELRTFILHDIAGALDRSYRRGDLNAFDVQKLRQMCRQAAWRFLRGTEWMQGLEMQELILNALEADLDLLENTCRRNLCVLPR